MGRTSAMLALSVGAVGGAALAVRGLRTDSTMRLRREGYGFISSESRRRGTDVFETRLVLRRAVCMTGPGAAETFYVPDRFTRRGAMPATTVRLLQDLGSVQTLDGEAFRRRKAMFLSLMGPESLQRMTDLVAEHWHDAVGRWEQVERVVLQREVSEILCRAACAWAGIPLPESEAVQRTRELTAMIEGAGSAGPRLGRGLLLRERSERWLRDLVTKVRSGQIPAAEDSPLQTVTSHRDTDGRELTTEAAAVELLNLLRPIVAIALFVTFSATALHNHPRLVEQLRDGDDDEVERFVQEVRRFYPFFPFIGGRVREEFDFAGRHFTQGTQVVLDLYGIDHDPRIWDDPDEFRPDRFRQRDGSPYDLVPQGGGDHYLNHRCAGEWMTIAVMKRAVRLLVGSMTYAVPEQDLRVSPRTMPASPRSGFQITNVRPAGTGR